MKGVSYPSPFKGESWVRVGSHDVPASNAEKPWTLRKFAVGLVIWCSMSESDLHRALKNVACRWLLGCGYAAIAQEVAIPGVGIIDAAASGKWTRHNPRAVSFDRIPQVDRCHNVFVECKAYRADFLRDQGRQSQFAFALSERKQNLHRRSRKDHRYASSALGKFDTCLLRPHAHLHYLLTPPRLLKTEEVPRRWGWLVYEENRVRIVRKPIWQEVVNPVGIEGAIARALTARMFRVGTVMKRPVETGHPGRAMPGHSPTPAIVRGTEVVR